MKGRLQGLVAGAARRPALTIAVTALLALGGALLATTLRPSTGSDTFVSRSAASYRATATDHRLFGSDAVVILIRESLPNLVSTKDLATASFLEACLAGQYLVPSSQLQSFTPAPAGSHAPYGGWNSPCGQLMRHRPVQVVYGPGTFLNRAVAAVNLQIRSVLASAQTAIQSAGSAARQLALGRGLSAAQAARAAKAAQTLENQRQTASLYQLYLDSGISGTPRIDDPHFIPQIVYDQTRGVNQPKARFDYLFPTASSALIQVRLKTSLSDAQQSQAIRWIRQAVAMPQFRSGYNGVYTVSGAPVVLDALASSLSGQIALLLACAVAVMAIVLLLVFRPGLRPTRHPASSGGAGPRSSAYLRLLPLVVALAAAGITFGVLWLFGGSLTMADIAVLPILIGLAVDYAIQFQSRVGEELSRGGGARAALGRAAGAGAPAIAVAALATATGFLVLLLSPVPMVRGFGLLLVAGVAVALLCALTGVAAAAVLAERDGGVLRASLRGAAEIVREAAARRPRPSTTVTVGPPRSGRVSAVSGAILAQPGRVLAVGAALALLGWVADTQTSVQTDVTKLVPSHTRSLQDLHTLERVTGVSGQLDVLVHAGNVATPAVVGWMLSLENELQNHFHYLETQGCATTKLCPALSLPDLFSSGSSARGVAAVPSQATINALLASVPSYFSQAVLSPDHHYATLAFGIRLMPLAEQQKVIDYIRSRLHPPAGASAAVTGLPVLAAEADSALSSSPRRLLTLLAALAAVAAMLLLVFRDRRRALVPLVPIALATGWSALVVFLIGIPLNPMSATLGTLVIAISTEFSVLLSERYRQERRAGAPAPEALALTRRSTGRAALASGITAIAGFGVLIASPITMLRDFGLVTVVDLSVSLAGVLLVLPAVLAFAEREDLGAALRATGERLPALIPRPRRRAPAA